MASLNPKEKIETKENVTLEEEFLGQRAAVEHIVHHDFIRESREFWKKEMAKEMQGERDVNTKTVSEKNVGKTEKK